MTDHCRFRWRRRRRPRWLRRGDRQPRLRLCAGADQPPRAGRQLGRRQDGDQCRRRQESRRRVPPAFARADRSFAARHARSAGGPRRLCRDRQICADRRRARCSPGSRTMARRSSPAILPRRTQAIAAAVAGKARIVEEDERETSGRRALLNLGHTFGHALEAETGYSDRLLHGEAVALGLRACLRFLGRARALQHGGRASACERILQSVGLPTSLAELGLQGQGERLAAHMQHDKKRAGGRTAFILVRGIGEAFVDRSVELCRGRGVPRPRRLMIFAEVIGDPIAQSKSPLIHKYWLDRLGIAGDYVRTRVPRDELARFLDRRRSDPGLARLQRHHSAQAGDHPVARSAGCRRPRRSARSTAWCRKAVLLSATTPTSTASRRRWIPRRFAGARRL